MFCSRDSVRFVLLAVFLVASSGVSSAFKAQGGSPFPLGPASQATRSTAPSQNNLPGGLPPGGMNKPPGG